MGRFDFYEFVGVLAPGLALIAGISLVYPDVSDFVFKPNFSIGDFGVAVILAYIAGHLLQALGNILEGIYWKLWGGMPTDWQRSNKHQIISDGQALQLEDRLRPNLKKEKVGSITELSQGAWRSLTNEMYGRVKAQAQDARVHTFNGNYGLMRGVAAVFIIFIVIVLLTHGPVWVILIPLILLFGLALARMHRFAVYYARELFTSFLIVTKYNHKDYFGIAPMSDKVLFGIALQRLKKSYEADIKSVIVKKSSQ